MRRLVARRQERRHRTVDDQSVDTVFSGQQELEQKAQAAAVRRAARQETTPQAVEACSSGQAATVQTGTSCEDRDAEAD